MITALLYAAFFALIAFGIACLTDWLMSVIAPYSNIPVEAAAVQNETHNWRRTQHRVPLSYGKGTLRYQAELRELPFLC